MTPAVVAAGLLCALVGVSLGLLGGGGSILAVPILIYVARLPAREAIGASLALVGTTSLLAAGLHARAGRVDRRAAALFGVAGLAGAPLGAAFTHRVPEHVLLLLFAALMVVVGGLMLKGRAEASPSAAPHALPLVLGAGFVVGLATGFLGIGGGFLIVPALTLLVGLPMPRAIGTSLAVIAANAFAGFAAHLVQGAIPVGLTVALTACALAGALAGTRAAAGWDPGRLRRSFAGFVVVVGVFVAARNLPALLR